MCGCHSCNVIHVLQAAVLGIFPRLETCSPWYKGNSAESCGIVKMVVPLFMPLLHFLRIFAIGSELARPCYDGQFARRSWNGQGPHLVWIILKCCIKSCMVIKVCTLCQETSHWPSVHFLQQQFWILGCYITYVLCALFGFLRPIGSIPFATFHFTNKRSLTLYMTVCDCQSLSALLCRSDSALRGRLLWRCPLVKMESQW